METKDESIIKDLWFTFNTIKGLATIISTNGIEDFRKCCGVNGYLLNSGIATIAQDSLLWPEGDYNILGSEGIQFGAFSLKYIRQLINGGPKLCGHMEYLNLLILLLYQVVL
jgi:hypothetical protein